MDLTSSSAARRVPRTDERGTMMEKPEETRVTELWAAAAVVLDSIDYQNGACGPTEMVAAVLPVAVLERFRKAINYPSVAEQIRPVRVKVPT